jgi:trehalose/maltose hydrolase-like predicted phosphorylase
MLKIRFNGAALYPMVTMNGEECHNEWKLPLKKFIEMDIAFAIYNYHRYTGDYSYIPERIRGFDWYAVLASKSNFSAHKTNM